MAIRIAGVDVINDDRELVLAKLTEINSSIDDTAVDVFVYDTSKDSDGGAWRHRTQHTSWYAEASSASRDPNTRSTRAEFPAVAVIVAESNKVTIYDGDDPSLPMWMVFNVFGGNMAGEGSNHSLSALNGILTVGSSAYDLYVVRFIADEGLQYSSSLAVCGTYKGSIEERNDNLSWLTGTTPLIISRIVNDVAMTVLPDAPTDPATGLPVPTIAVATDGGVSVIKDDGTVVDIVHSDNAETRNVTFGGDDLLIYNAASFIHARPIPTADVSAGNRYVSNAADVWFAPRFFFAPYTGGSFELHPYGGSLGDMIQSGNFVAIQNNDRLNLARVEDTYAEDNALSAFVTSTYNTGWMNGDIKLAALADTTAETLSGSELLSAFSDASWTTTDSDWQYDSTNDEWDFAASAGVVSALTHTVSTTEGAVYVATATVSNVANVVTNELFLRMEGTADGVVELSKDDGSGAVISQPSGGDGTYTATFTAGASNPYFQIRSSALVDGDETATLVSASVRLADPDRSVNGKGLAVYGSITKAPVATGADVVAYSGFSSSGGGAVFLEQPYNDDLDFGTGDFCYSYWVYQGDSNGWHFMRGPVGAQSTGVRVLNGTITAYVKSAQVTSGTIIVAESMWHHIVFLRRSGTAEIWLNGSLELSVSNSSNIIEADAVLRLGMKTPSIANAFDDGSLALFRVSATAPTADQIRKIYEDERRLFQEDAKATLTGSSDAVTALAHDPDTELLHVGTSGGRSVFQGLRRVEEHTGTDNQSLAAISAVDGLVVEGK